MEVKKDMTNATSGGIHTETSIPAVGKYKRPPGKVVATAIQKIVCDPHYGFVVEKLSRAFSIQKIN
jgi:hypothetical protein